MFRPGLVSITFRNLSPAEIITLCEQANLSGIEWGGDIHVPHGDVAKAREVAAMTREAGCEVAAYGSYYALTPELDGQPAFEDVLATAVALGAPTIRVWAGKKGSAEATEAEREAIAQEALLCADQAAAEGCRISYEYHQQSLTDTVESARALLDATRHPAIDTLWQPINRASDEENVRSAASIMDRLANVHIFEWQFPGGERVVHPLADGEQRWKRFFNELRKAPPTNPRFALLEFVKDGKPEQAIADAATLHRWLEIWGLLR